MLCKNVVVSKGGSADCAGLKEGDRILRINGINVAGSGTDSIARVIRYFVVSIHGHTNIRSIKCYLRMYAV